MWLLPCGVENTVEVAFFKWRHAPQKYEITIFRDPMAENVSFLLIIQLDCSDGSIRKMGLSKIAVCNVVENPGATGSTNQIDVGL